MQQTDYSSNHLSSEHLTCSKTSPRRRNFICSSFPSSSSSSSTSSRSASSSNRSMRSMLLCVSLVVLLAPTDAYFNRIMNCKQLCEMLESNRIRQLWCVLKVCQKERLGDAVLRYGKRTPLDDATLRDQSQRDTNRKFLSDYVFEKRDKEYWEGPAPADTNQ